jgi:hypothetical protein
MDRDLAQKIDDYVDDGWRPMMVQIWQDRIERLRILRTGQLHESFSSAIHNASGGKTIKFRFVEYGAYVAMGTGKGYAKDNGGDLKFLDKEYRKQHRLDKRRRVGPAWGGHMTSGKPRKRRDWFSSKYFRSVMVLKEELARITGEQAGMVIANALSDTREVVK